MNKVDIKRSAFIGSVPRSLCACVREGVQMMDESEGQEEGRRGKEEGRKAKVGKRRQLQHIR
jgi:hypothetical protein